MSIAITNEDTIVALATPAGTGAISVIRVSGRESFVEVDKIFRGKNKIVQAQSHTIHYGKLFNEAGEIIDDVLVSVFHNPNSYTGEDSVEISTHGSQLIVQKIISELLNGNIRLAEPGEFTKRAYLNGKIDLSQAEAVIDIINSRTEASLRGARNQLDGLLSAKVETLREQIINSSSLIELELDFAEEDLEFISLKDVQKNINEIICEINFLLKSYSFGKILKDGVNVAIVGKPNVGKSSLLNFLLKESRAIVSSIPGTTRDVIREEVALDGILFRLFDTAGLRITDNEIEKEGVQRSNKAVKNADIILFIYDVEEDFPLEVYNQLLELISAEKIIRVLNKIDLKKETMIPNDVSISALTGEGIESLFEIMKSKAIDSDAYTEKTAIVSNIRHFNALENAKKNLQSANNSIQQKMSGEFIAVDLRNATDNLGEIIGRVTTDDILNNIFSKFCIGK